MLRCGLHLLVLPLALAGVVPVAIRAADAGSSPPAGVSDEAVDEPTALPEAVSRNPNALQRLWTWSDARVRGMADYILPDTLERATLRLSVQPRLGDFVRHDHVRLPMSLSYGLKRRSEVEVGFDPYFPNPFKDGAGSGAANIRAGLKHQWAPPIDASVRAASGLRVVHPLSSAPFRFNHGVNRYSIFQTFARPSPWNPELEGFLNLSYDLITPSAADGAIDRDDPQNDFYQVGAGWLMRKKRMTYGLAFAYAHTTDGVGTSFTTVTPSVIFDVPSRYMFKSPGQWQLGASVEGKRYGDDNELSVKLRVRWNVDFRKVVKDWRETRARPRLAASNP